MTFREALDGELMRIRKPYWNEFAFLELPGKVEVPGHGRLRGPWCKLHDIGQVLDLSVLEADDGKPDWVPFEGDQDRLPGPYGV